MQCSDVQPMRTVMLTGIDQFKGEHPKKNGLVATTRPFISHQPRRTQNSLRPLLAAMRMRSALSLMKPAASAWL